MDKNIFSQKLVELRKAHKFKQREVAKNLGFVDFNNKEK